MTIMNTELYEALVAGGAPDDKAKAAANVVEEQNKRFDQIDNRFDKMQNDMDNRFDKVDHKIEHLETSLKLEIQTEIAPLRQDIAILREGMNHNTLLLRGIAIGGIIMIVKSFF